MSEQQIEVKPITQDPEEVMYFCLTKLIWTENGADRAILVKMVDDAFEEYKLQNIK